MIQPDVITVAKLEVVLMPNGEIICNGKGIGFFKDLRNYLSEPRNGRDGTPLRLNGLKDMLTVEEVAQLFSVSKLTIKRWGKSGRLKPIRINSRGDRRYFRDDIFRMLGI